MILQFLGNEDYPAYKSLSSDNLIRQYDFLNSIIVTAVNTRNSIISTALIKALNYHAIACLHINAGEYRPCSVKAGDYKAPKHFLVPEMMNDFINRVNRYWEADIWHLTAYCLWRLNYIHPFINGNGRTARALCYFVVCVKSGGLIGGQPILPELIRKNRDEYVELLQDTDIAFKRGRQNYLEYLSKFLKHLLVQQVRSIRPR